MHSSRLPRGTGLLRCLHEILFSLSVGFIFANALLSNGSYEGFAVRVDLLIDDLLSIARRGTHGNYGAEVAFVAFMLLVAQSFLLLLMYLRLAPKAWSRVVLCPDAGIVALFGAPVSWFLSDPRFLSWHPFRALEGPRLTNTWCLILLIPLAIALAYCARQKRIPLWLVLMPLVLDYYCWGSNIWMATAFVLPPVAILLYLTRKVRVSVWALYLPLSVHYYCWVPVRMAFDLFFGFASTPNPVPVYAILVWPAFGLVWLLYVIVSQERNNQLTAAETHGFGLAPRPAS